MDIIIYIILIWAIIQLSQYASNQKFIDNIIKANKIFSMILSLILLYNKCNTSTYNIIMFSSFIAMIELVLVQKIGYYMISHLIGTYAAGTQFSIFYDMSIFFNLLNVFYVMAYILEKQNIPILLRKIIVAILHVFIFIFNFVIEQLNILNKKFEYVN